MKKLFFILLVSILMVSFTSCQKTFERIRKGVQTSDRHYTIEQYSGGKLIKTYDFKGILNDSENSDGYYFYNGDTLVEISGDLIIKSVKD